VDRRLQGWWKTVDGSRCEPLTVRDAFSRFVLCIKAMPNTSMDPVREQFTRLFRKYGIPSAIQCDNGLPFISVLARGGLTRLSGWWVALGIQIVRSRPACPQDNGGHERMHRDIRADVQAFPAAHRDAEQRVLDRWKQEFNHVRPHEALGGKVPADFYQPNANRSLTPIRHEYPLGWSVRKVFGRGVICINCEQRGIARALVGYSVGLQPLDGTRYRLWFGELDLGELETSPSTAAVNKGCEKFLERRKTKASKR
jgi:putative transposase